MVATETIVKLAQFRKTDPPTIYDASLGREVSIAGDVEDALILVSTEFKRKAISYIDALIEFKPTTNNRDRLIIEATETRQSDLKGKITELEAVIDDYKNFKGGISMIKDLDASASDIQRLTNGLSRLFTSLQKGIGPITRKYRETIFTNKNLNNAPFRYVRNVSDSYRREWRSWKCVLSSYMV